MDDRLLFQNDAGKILSNEESKEALEERGLYVILLCGPKNCILIIILRPFIFFSLTNGLGHKDLQAQLSWWLESVQVANEEVADSAIARRLALIISSR